MLIAEMVLAVITNCFFFNGNGTFSLGGGLPHTAFFTTSRNKLMLDQVDR